MGEKARVLVAEDERMAAEILTSALCREGYEVSTAYDGEEAMQFLAQHNFDAAILDLKMPGKDGLEILEAINPKETYVCVIIATGYASPDTMRQAFSTGVFDYIPKPLLAAEVLERLDKGLKRRKRVLAALADPHREDRLKKLLKIHRKNLFVLKEREAQFTKMHVPLEVLHMIEIEEQEIGRIERELAEYEAWEG